MLSHTCLSALTHIHPSKMTTETFDPKPAVGLCMETADLGLNQGLRGPPSSSTMQDAEEEDSEEDIFPLCTHTSYFFTSVFDYSLLIKH